MSVISMGTTAQSVPLPEHPRPDFERELWKNLNGTWLFTLDSVRGEHAAESGDATSFDMKINVPFGWGSPLSGVSRHGNKYVERADNIRGYHLSGVIKEDNKGFYARDIVVPKAWKGRRVFLVIGACDWDTEVWLNGHKLVRHQGGFTPFEAELTSVITGYDTPQHLVICVDDTPSDSHVSGKQEYGDVHGIWQTVYMEARGASYIDYVHFSPDIDNSRVKVEVGLDKATMIGETLTLHFKNSEENDFVYKIALTGQNDTVQTFNVPLHEQRLWSIDSPYLYYVRLSLMKKGKEIDGVNTYFGQRKIGVVNLPGSSYPYVALNDKPVYLQMTLDQSYNAEGYYTFPSDEFMKNEILISKQLGLNGNRIHIKTEIPRKLYWADKLGLLIMQDIPCRWGDDNAEGRLDWERCMRAQIKRDYNHPCIFSWVDFNENWGVLTTNKADGSREYLPASQQWVNRMWKLNKQLDPTRLVEDMSATNHDHLESDINSWHAYAAGFEWDDILGGVCENTWPGSTWNYAPAYRQTGVPMINSEFGNAYRYSGSKGDVDITWDYHKMMNSFRAHPACAGWVYTEHHDVETEWNGYVHYDRTPKMFGLDAFVPGMTIRDLHSACYVSPRCDLMQEVKAGTEVKIKRYISVMTDNPNGPLSLLTTITGWNDIGETMPEEVVACDTIAINSYFNGFISSVNVCSPMRNGLYVVRFVLSDRDGNVVHRNFTLLRVKGGATASDETNVKVLSFVPSSFTAANWSQKLWTAMDSDKVNGAGHGYFEYTLQLPEDIDMEKVKSVAFRFEASSKRLNSKDRDEAKGLNTIKQEDAGHDCSAHPCSYPQTGYKPLPTSVIVKVDGTQCAELKIDDDPADHRGVLSWQAQGRNLRLDEAGSYGYLQNVVIPKFLFSKSKKIVVRLEVSPSCDGGLALYGEDSGFYPMNPMILFSF